MAAIFQTTFSCAFSGMKIYKLWLIFNWSLFPGVQLTIFQHWFRQWLGTVQATSHYLNQWWLNYWSIYGSLGFNELTTGNFWKHYFVLVSIASPDALCYSTRLSTSQKLTLNILCKLTIFISLMNIGYFDSEFNYDMESIIQRKWPLHWPRIVASVIVQYHAIYRLASARMT